MNQYELIPFETADALTHAAASAWMDEIENANLEMKPHHVALSGGRITQKLLSEALKEVKGGRISLSRVHFFWADERCVPPPHADSNYRVVREMFLEPLGIPPEQVHRIRGEEMPETAAQLAEAEICSLVPQNENRQPILDLIFLGLGEDGHTASLFPDEAESVAASAPVYRAITGSPKPPPNRVTLGYPTIAAARRVWMLASGAAKEDALRESLALEARTPFGRVLRARSDTKIFTDILLK
jgi:6-phosphogluconolactonase